MSFRKSLTPYYVMGGLTAALLAVAAASGLLSPGIYRSYLSQGLIAFQSLQDALSLVLAVALVAAILATARGSLRGFVVWAGLLIFVVYYYSFFAFGKLYNTCYPVYLALVGLGTYSLIGLLTGVDLPGFVRSFRAGLPVRFIAIVLAMPILLAPLWIGGVLKAIATQQIGETALVFVMDLCFLIPAGVYAAAQLWRRRPVGYLLAGPLLVKFVLSGVLLAAGELQKGIAGQGMAVEQLAMWVFLALAGSAALAIYVRSLRSESRQAPRGAVTA